MAKEKERLDLIDFSSVDTPIEQSIKTCLRKYKLCSEQCYMCFIRITTCKLYAVELVFMFLGSSVRYPYLFSMVNLRCIYISFKPKSVLRKITFFGGQEYINK